MAAVMNAVWDLAARRAGKPLWRLLVDMTPEQLADAADLKYLSDVLTRDEAVAMLAELAPTREQRVAELDAAGGYPCYTTSAGWLGYSDDKLRHLLREAVDAGYRHVKLKVGADLEDDVRRLTIAREEIGWDADLMIDANQVWDVPEAIAWMEHLAPFRPLWIEEPTSPDDVLGHAAIRRAVAPIGVATGEHGMNRVLFKQLFQAEAIDFCQLDSARLASVNEILAVYLMAKKFGVPVCPHAGGVGLCELVQHLSIFDFVAVSGTPRGPGHRVRRPPARALHRALRRGRTAATCCRPRPATAPGCTSRPSPASPTPTASTGRPPAPDRPSPDPESRRSGVLARHAVTGALDAACRTISPERRDASGCLIGRMRVGGLRRGRGG